jgi:hypothetical protein
MMKMPRAVPTIFLALMPFFRPLQADFKTALNGRAPDFFFCHSMALCGSILGIGRQPFLTISRSPYTPA